jgi:hypothetical protein
VKVGDLVQGTLPLISGDVGTVVEVKPYVEGCRGNYKVGVYWGPDPQFGSSFEWDWDYDLKVVEGS